jgi:hypothetical protein
MTAIIWCKEKEVLTLYEQPIPRIGEQIVVERNGRKTYRVEDVLWSYRFIPTANLARPMTDHRIEIHVREVA